SSMSRGAADTRWTSSRRSRKPLESTRSGIVKVADALTVREREVATLVARGLTNRQIAQQLVIAEGTADRHLTLGPRRRFWSRTPRRRPQPMLAIPVFLLALIALAVLALRFGEDSRDLRLED